MFENEARDELFDRAMGLGSEEFEHLCKILVEQTEPVTDIELTPFRGDGGIDVRGAVGHQFLQAQFGVQVKQHTGRVGAPAMRNFIGALRDHNYQFGGFITTSEFNSGAIDTAEGETGHPITLVNRDRLLDIMLHGRLGVASVGDQYDIDEAFWDLFGTATGEDLVKSDAVPQADSLDVINVVIEGIGEGHRFKHQIHEYMQAVTAEEWDPRQADYYPQAAWALGYVHKNTRDEYEGRTMRKWGLTRDGEEYLTYLQGGDDEAADESLLKHIREADIIERVLERLRPAETITHEELGEIIEKESELNETTADRRRGTVGVWLDLLPEVRQAREGQSFKYEYLATNLNDY